MSSLLQQAIVDAKALKEAANKSAEKAILEKYQEEIKSVYSSMLEQDIDPLGDMAGEKSAERDDEDDELGDLDFEDDLELGPDSLGAQMPYAYEEGENLCACPDEDEEIEIDFDQLAAMLQGGDSQPAAQPDPMASMGVENEDDMDFSNLKLEEDTLEENIGDSVPGKTRPPLQIRLKSKGMGNAPEDELTNVSPNVKDRDIKTKGKDILNMKEGEGDTGDRKIQEMELRTHGNFKFDWMGNHQIQITDVKNNITIYAGQMENQTGTWWLFFKTPIAKGQPSQDPIESLGKVVIDRRTPQEETEKQIAAHLQQSLQEKVIIDDKGNKSGWTARPTDILSHELDKQVAHSKSDKKPSDAFKDKDYNKDLEDKETEYDNLKETYNTIKQKFNEIYKENLNLREANSNYTMKTTSLEDQNTELKQLLVNIQGELKKIQLNSSKLFFENKVFRNASLNERQKNMIVEAISEIDTVEQVKPVYEALLKTKGALSSNKKETSNPLREAMRNRPNVARIAGSSGDGAEKVDQQDALNEAVKARMKKLAGIK